MDRQTRQLLRLLADDLSDQLLGTLEAGEMLEVDIPARLGARRQTAAERLRALEGWGITASEDRRTPGRGRPTRAWRLASDWSVRFSDAADAQVLELLTRRASEQDEAIRRRTRERTQVIQGHREAQ